MSDLRIAVSGAAGRMGRRVIAQVLGQEGMTLAAAVDGPNSEFLDQDAGTVAGVGEAGIPITSEYGDGIDAIIDFSTPPGLEQAANFSIERAVPLVAATTGLTELQIALIDEAAKKTAVVFAPNMSLAVNLCMKLASDAAAALKDAPGGADVEVVERHHRYKEDAPSGTALHFGKLVAEQMGQSNHVHGRDGRPGARPHDEIGYHALRLGDTVGEHNVTFGLLGETIELTVRSHTRDSYAIGAVAAAKFVAGRSPGHYTMNDVLGL
ncbi:4-hydroxy-tetrahydrodipicolinate reductase [Stratiformator vulcanicus]|uniref:4-hydroxy-tetrahydrodipicolinate reductase n=1 Tax=Stratiformator vulcanicus TaxID=2527980 RepID=A0A517R5K7_9PLAN|nr:4-hydroxy-tetrahydrodipicolinate reductase [Stratiformator vulcanicus]QDT39162.1 4-hydroxy-tetrahydrodipicolinate reductase [Stratiformator vulcanicus]